MSMETYAAPNRSIVNEAAAASPVQPIVNMGQGFLYVLASSPGG